MAVTTTKKQDQQLSIAANPQLSIASAPQQQTQYPETGYAGLAGVSDSTAQQVGNYQQGYQQGDAVKNAQQQLQAIQAAKPQGYNSRFGTQLDSIMQQLQNPKDFKYSFNEDEMFKNYADLYYQQGKQASLDTLGQAAALTGGYGNSYGQQAANQAFQQHLLRLYEMGPQFQQMAYQQYRDKLGDQKDLYGIVADAEQRDYDRYRDEMGDWKGERDYWTGREDTLSERDRAAYEADRDYWTGLARVENADYRSEQERQEAIRQYEQDFAEKQRQYDTSLAEEQRQYDTTLAENQRQFDADEAYRRDTFEWQKETDQRDYDRSVLENDRNFTEEQRQFNEKLQEDIRQFNESLNWDKMSSEQKYAAEYAMQILANGQIPSEELLKAAGLSSADAQKMIAKTKTGSGSTKKTTPKTYYTDMYGNYYEFDKNGNAKMVDSSVVTKNDIVDPSLGNFQYNLGNAARDAAKTVQEQWDGSQLKETLTNGWETIKNAGTSLLDSFGLGSLINNKKK